MVVLEYKGGKGHILSINKIVIILFYFIFCLIITGQSVQ